MRKLALVLLMVVMSAGLASGCQRLTGQGSNVPPPQGIPAETTSTSVFYSTGRTLVEEMIIVDAGDVYEATLKEMLLAQPKENKEIAIVQTVSPFNFIEFDDKSGLMTVDWDSDILLFDAEPAEKRLAYASIMMTMGQFPEVKKVKFTVNGKDSGKIDGKDVNAFWGAVSLNDQPWDALRPPNFAAKSGEATGSAEATKTK